MSERIKREVLDAYHLLSKKKTDQLLRERSGKLLSLGVFFERSEKRRGLFGRRKQ
jgi:hypothetical protein